MCMQKLPTHVNKLEDLGKSLITVMLSRLSGGQIKGLGLKSDTMANVAFYH